MAYNYNYNFLPQCNLRRRPLNEQLLEDDEHQEALDASSDEEDVVEKDDMDFEPSSDSSSEEAVEDNNIENASLKQRFLDARERQRELYFVQQGRGGGRGRPSSILKGTNGYKWSTRVSERRSGRHFEHEERIPGPTCAAVGLMTFEDLWKVPFTDALLEIIETHTNNQIEKVCIEMIANGS
ncbi:hypothetical protein ABEB36_014451 [Hypothenemus hampei]|uniref:Uncharacterized protein n=1 Tax=Hypothenemus hampei TaxID=57062 RepID=A0ABD1E6G4_HYPHA